jgi:hypothetical protein
VSFLSLLPLDAAADTGLLVTVDWLSGKHCVDRGTQIAARDWLVAAGAAVVELAPIKEPPFTVEEIEIWSACRSIGFCDILGFVKTEGKGETKAFGHFLQPGRRVIRILHRVVAADSDNA